MRQSANIALRFWAARGLHPCPPRPEVYVAPSLMDGDGVDAGGRAELGGCRIWLRRSFVRDAQRENPYRGRGGDAREQLCVTVVHEFGHLAGLQHTDTGLMSPIGAAVPWECRAWLRALDRRATRRTRVPR